MTLTLDTGPLQPVVTQGDGSWLARLFAPTLPGAARLEVAIDEVPLKVQPHI